MRPCTTLPFLSLCTALLSALTSANPAPEPDSEEQLWIRNNAHSWEATKRGIIAPAQLQTNYDFIICGGGLAGLVIAARLSEDANKTVLVIEAGDTGLAVQQQISVPGNAYYSTLLNTDYDWQYKTVNQTNLGGRVLDWPRGRVLGGSTAVNGLYLVRPSALEVNAWSALANDTNEFWTWASLFEAMKKSETFTPPSDAIKQLGQIEYDLANHGTSGPLSYSYPGFLLPIVGEWTTVLEGIGILASPDPSGGFGYGGFIATSSINPGVWTRSYARSAYIDPLPARSNLHILPNARVLKIETTTAANGSVTATGVTYSTSPTVNATTITANKEVILTGGSVGSPQMLMLSGIGNKAELAAFGIQSVIDLPGVGQHVQDHIASEVIYKTSAATAASSMTNQTLTNGSETFLSFVNSAIAYANITDLFGDYDATFQEEVKANLTWALNNICPSDDPTIRAGYSATYTTSTDKVLLSKVGQVELLLGLTGTAQGGDDSFAIQAALQHGFSRGTIKLKSASPWEYPTIDPNYLAHPADVFLLREGLKLARKLGSTDPLSKLVISEVYPGPSVQTDAQWDAWLRTTAKTEYHPSCSCAMMPLSLGGVIAADLKVHGTTNLRVADSSIYPIEFAAHLMAPTYGVAEKAADIIKGDHGGVRLVANKDTSPTISATASGTASRTSGRTATAGAASTTPASGASRVAVGGLSLISLLASFVLLA